MQKYILLTLSFPVRAWEGIYTSERILLSDTNVRFRLSQSSYSSYRPQGTSECQFGMKTSKVKFGFVVKSTVYHRVVKVEKYETRLQLCDNSSTRSICKTRQKQPGIRFLTAPHQTKRHHNLITTCLPWHFLNSDHRQHTFSNVWCEKRPDATQCYYRSANESSNAIWLACVSWCPSAQLEK